jgi:hypothetical protein
VQGVGIVCGLYLYVKSAVYHCIVSDWRLTPGILWYV